MAEKKPAKRKVESYQHKDKKRLNNPPVGLVAPETDPEPARKAYAYDPHLDPQLVWAGKAEHTSFEVPTVSLHVHERIDPRTIIEVVRRRNGNGAQMSLFAAPEENPPIRQAIEFYKHPHNWSNRLIAGDSLLVMNSLLEKEGMAGQVQMIYIDPPYGIKYGSNFQPFINGRDIQDGKDEDLTQEPEMIRAFRDTWEPGIHSYLTYLRDRLLLTRELLTESGSVFVQIGDENTHHVREVMDEVFGARSLIAIVIIRKTASATAELIGSTADFLLWYAKDRAHTKFHPLFVERANEADDRYDQVELADGTRGPPAQYQKSEKADSLPLGARRFRLSALTSTRPPGDFPVEFEGKIYHPRTGYWKTGVEGFRKLIAAHRVAVTTGDTLRYVRYSSDFPLREVDSIWTDVYGSVQSRSDPKVYVVRSPGSIWRISRGSSGCKGSFSRRRAMCTTRCRRTGPRARKAFSANSCASSKISSSPTSSRLSRIHSSRTNSSEGWSSLST